MKHQQGDWLRGWARTATWLGLLGWVLPACGEDGASGADATRSTATVPRAVRPQLEEVTADRLEAFASQAEFDDYVRQLRIIRQEALPVFRRFHFGFAATAPMAAMESADTGESITNTQETGVDEGDIVKPFGQHLVILRRGRLFSVRLGDRARREMTPLPAVNAYAPGTDQGTWYDEMLIHGDQLVVVGYSYRVGATELGLFRIAEDGRIEHRATHFLRSNDYYSSRNYASRLVDGKLVFYMPYQLFSRRYRPSAGAAEDPISLPALVSAEREAQGAWRDIIAASDIYRPIQPTIYPTLHTVVRCDLEREPLSCTSVGVMGPYARSFYVSADAVYLWVNSERRSETSGEAAEGASDRALAAVYRLPLDGEAPQALKALGSPIDQFSFKEDAAGYLNVVVRPEGWGDAMWATELGRGNLALVRAPLSRFSSTPVAVSLEDYTMLPAPGEGAQQNRFVGDHLLYGAGSSWFREERQDQRVFVLPYRRPYAVTQLELGHSVDRIEALGSDAVVVGTAGDELRFTSVELGRTPPARRDTYVIEDAVQGELRSHGFFFKPAPRGGGGILGLPVRHSGRPSAHLLTESAEVVFLRVGGDLTFDRLGVLSTSAQGQLEDHCQVSCVDWYGNSRPIFYRGRIFALLGYELVEGSLSRDGLTEAGRTVFYTSSRP